MIILNIKELKTQKTTTVSYYKKYTDSSISLVDALKQVGVNSSFSNRKIIAKNNGISSYTGTASQNTQLLNLLKNGKNKVQDFLSCSFFCVNILNYLIY